MLLVISPAKTLDYETPSPTKIFSIPAYLDHSKQLIQRARQYNELDIMTLMSVSAKIAELNVQRFADWNTPFTPKNAKQSVLAFKGEVYTGLAVERFSEDDFQFAQQHLRILSGLYGLLRPLDLMQAYRLEMGRKIETDRGKNLYAFWGEIITEGLNEQLDKLDSKHLINLASNEYFKSIKPNLLKAEIITPEFKDYNNGAYKMMGVYAKKARGMLSQFIIQNKINNPKFIQDFSEANYKFNKKMSQGNTWVFTRKNKPTK
ncbi:MAG: peroxide stress protein YaaA [Gammaproteobacteria bacterium]|nr:peroxide stress protein YaaA [Gammaproteobacteria bacterium]